MRLLAHMLTHFVQNGTLRVIDANGKLHVFNGSPEPIVTMRLSDKALHRKVALSVSGDLSSAIGLWTGFVATRPAVIPP